MKTKSIILVTALSAFGGCASPDPVMAPHTLAADPLPYNAYPQIVLLGGLQNVMVGDFVDTVPREGNVPMRVCVEVRSVYDGTIRAQYRFLYFNQTGESIDRNPIWQETIVQPRTRIQLNHNALSLRAADWKLEIRPS